MNAQQTFEKHDEKRNELQTYLEARVKERLAALEEPGAKEARWNFFMNEAKKAYAEKIKIELVHAGKIPDAFPKNKYYEELQHFDWSDFIAMYQETFGEKPWGEYMYCEKCKTQFALEDIQETEGSSERFLNSIDTTKKFHCGDAMKFLWPKERVLNFFQKKIHPNTLFTALYDREHKPQGFAIGYTTNMEDAWEQEWKSLYPEKKLEEEFKKNIADHLTSTNTKEIFLWSVVSITKQFRSKEHFWQLRSAFVEGLHNLPKDMLAIGECHKMSSFYKHMKILGGKELFSIPNTQQCIMILGKNVGQLALEFSYEAPLYHALYSPEFRKFNSNNKPV